MGEMIMIIKIVYDWGDGDTIITYPTDNVTDDGIRMYVTIIHPDWVFVVINHDDPFNRRYIMRNG